MISRCDFRPMFRAICGMSYRLLSAMSIGFG
jgi:hypothetical protein